jgi:hypothetical protein
MHEKLDEASNFDFLARKWELHHLEGKSFFIGSFGLSLSTAGLKHLRNFAAKAIAPSVHKNKPMRNISRAQ